MCEADAFMRGFTRALARRSITKQTGKQIDSNLKTDIFEHKPIKRLSDDQYKQFITTKMIAYINKHKEAKP